LDIFSASCNTDIWRKLSPEPALESGRRKTGLEGKRGKEKGLPPTRKKAWKAAQKKVFYLGLQDGAL